LGKPSKGSANVVGAPTDIGTGFFPNVSVKDYCYTDLLGPVKEIGVSFLSPLLKEISSHFRKFSNHSYTRSMVQSL
jgi:hypothetical protein